MYKSAVERYLKLG